MAPTTSKSTSVFHALGSYADRIKDPNTAPNSTSPSVASSSLASSPMAPSTAKLPSTQQQQQPQADDDGSWETVRVGRHKVRPERERQDRQDEKRASNSRNWRERDDKPESAKDKAGDDERRGQQSNATKKEASSSTTTTVTGKTQSAAAPARSLGMSSPTKPAWGATTPGQSSISLPSAASASTEKPLNARRTAASPPLPSANGTTSAPPIVPDEASSTKGTKSERVEVEGSWRARPKSAGPTPTSAPAPAPAPVAKKTAPPPAVNPWDVRKKNLTPAAPAKSASTQAQTSAASKAAAAPVLQFGSVSGGAAPEATTSTETNGDVKVAGKKTKKKAEAVPPPVSDTTLWPDVSQAQQAQAAETAKQAEEKKTRHEKKESETSSAVEEQPAPTQTGKKPKWTPISRSELQEAADKAAESSRRQPKPKARKGGDAESADKGGNRKKGGSNAAHEKKTRMQRSNSQGSEIRLPPLPEAHRGANANGFRFGTVEGDAERVNGGEGSTAVANGTMSLPLSRQPSQQSKRGSPALSSVPLSAETRAQDGSSPAATPQQTFPAANLPRPPRGRDRDGRGGYAGRGRGAYRSASQMSANSRLYADLAPLSGGEHPNMYQRGYGMGYSAYYPIPYMVPAAYDAAQGTYAGMPTVRGGAPPPLPVTQVANLDPLRYYVLGQTEYYFSMQNLAMDFFLRQQMDSEGWIDVAMIASFNRIKSLTPDVSVVREVMVLSTLLEVRDDMVRLAGDEAKRWVLPDARPSKFGASGASNVSPSPKKGAGEAAEISHGLPASVDTSGASALGFEDMIPPTSPGPKFDVENALMKSSGSANVSSTASVLNSDEGKTMTPATSVAGDAKSECDEVEDKA